MLNTPTTETRIAPIASKAMTLSAVVGPMIILRSTTTMEIPYITSAVLIIAKMINDII